MGITGLLPLLNGASQHINVKELKGSVAIVDTYCWLHRAAFHCFTDLFFNNDTDVYVDVCISRIQHLKKLGITCVLVFDGQNLPSKSHTEAIRHENREKTRAKIEQLLSTGNQSEATDLMKRCIDITPAMAKKLINACRVHNVDYIVAPYEADAQIAYLMHKGVGHFVITEDSDLLLFNCRYILVKMDRGGNGVLVRRSKIGDCLGFGDDKWDFEKFLRICILSGCDYLPSLPGIGLKKALKFFNITVSTNMRHVLPKLPSYLNMKNLRVDMDYVEGFIRAENTFKHQLVFCPFERRLVPLNPYEKCDVGSSEYDYAGPKMDDKFALEMALGNVCIDTLKLIDDWRPRGFDGDEPTEFNTIWSRQYKFPSKNVLDQRFVGKSKITPIKPKVASSSSFDGEKKKTRLFNIYESRSQETVEETSTKEKEECKRSAEKVRRVVKSRHFSSSVSEESSQKSTSSSDDCKRSIDSSCELSFAELKQQKEAKRRKIMSTVMTLNSSLNQSSSKSDESSSQESSSGHSTSASQSSTIARIEQITLSSPINENLDEGSTVKKSFFARREVEFSTTVEDTPISAKSKTFSFFSRYMPKEKARIV